MSTFIETLINGLAVGSLYALIALGYTMVYGILKFINFAHSDIFVVGAWSSLTIATAVLAATHPGVPVAEIGPNWLLAGLALLGAMAICAVIAFIVERLAYRPLRNAPRLNVLITAIGVSLLLQNVGQLKWVFGPSPGRMPSLLPDQEVTTVAGVPLRLVDLIGAATAVLLMLALEWLVYRTKLGRAMRAVSYNHETAALMGVPVDRVISFTFVLGAALAAAAGFLYSIKYLGLNQPAYSTWVLLGLKAFVAAVVGGIGNVRGAMLGGFFIGLVEFFGMTYLSMDYRDVYVFSILILVLLCRPSGLLGKAVVEKV